MCSIPHISPKRKENVNSLSQVLYWHCTKDLGSIDENWFHCENEERVNHGAWKVPKTLVESASVNLQHGVLVWWSENNRILNIMNSELNQNETAEGTSINCQKPCIYQNELQASTQVKLRHKKTSNFKCCCFSNDTTSANSSKEFDTKQNKILTLTFCVAAEINPSACESFNKNENCFKVLLSTQEGNNIKPKRTQKETENNEESVTNSAHSFHSNNSSRKFLLWSPVTQEEQQKSFSLSYPIFQSPFTPKKSSTPQLLLPSGKDDNFSWTSSLATPPGCFQCLPGDTDDSGARLKQKKPDRNLKHSFFPRELFGSPKSTTYEKPNNFCDDGTELAQVKYLYLQNVSTVKKDEQDVYSQQVCSSTFKISGTEEKQTEVFSLKNCDAVEREQQAYGSTLKINDTEEKHPLVSRLKVDESTDRTVNQTQHGVELGINKFINIEKTYDRHVAETQLPNINSHYNNTSEKNIQHSDMKEGIAEFVSDKTETEKPESDKQFPATVWEHNAIDITVKPVSDKYRSCINTRSSKISGERELERSVGRQASNIYILEGLKKSLDIGKLEKASNAGIEILNVKYISKTPVEVCERSEGMKTSQIPVSEGISSKHVMTCGKLKEEPLDGSYRIEKESFLENKSVCHSCEKISPFPSFECNFQSEDYKRKKLKNVTGKQEKNILPVLDKNLGFMFISTLFKKDMLGNNGEEDHGLLRSMWKKKSYEMCIGLENILKKNTTPSNCYSWQNKDVLINFSGNVSKMINGHLFYTSQLATSGSLSPIVKEGFCQASEASLDNTEEFRTVEEQKVIEISDAYDNLEVLTQVDNNFKNLNQSGRDFCVDCLSLNNNMDELIKDENQFNKKTSERLVDRESLLSSNFVSVDNQCAYLYVKPETFETKEPVGKDLTIQDISKNHEPSKQKNSRISKIDHITFKNGQRSDQTDLYPSNNSGEPFLYLDPIQYQQENQKEDEKSIFSFDEGKEEMFWWTKEKHSEKATSYLIQSNGNKVLRDLYKVLPIDQEMKPCNNAGNCHSQRVTVLDYQQSFMDTSVLSSNFDKSNLVGLSLDYGKIYGNLENNSTMKTKQPNKLEDPSTMDERKNIISEKPLSFARSLLDVDLIKSKTSKSPIKILTNVNEQKFTTASGKELSVSKSSFNFAKCLFNEDFPSEKYFKPEDKEQKKYNKSFLVGSEVFISDKSNVTNLEKEINTSEKSSKYAELLLYDNLQTGGIIKHSLKNTKRKSSSRDLSKASENKISISEDYFRFAKLFFSENLLENKNTTCILKDVKQHLQLKDILSSEVKKINLATKALEFAKSLPHSDTLEDEHIECLENSERHPETNISSVMVKSDVSKNKNKSFLSCDSEQHKFNCFSASGGKETVSEKPVKLTNTLFHDNLLIDENVKANIKDIEENSISRGFLTAGGNKISFSEKSLNFAKSFLNDDVRSENTTSDVKDFKQYPGLKEVLTVKRKEMNTAKKSFKTNIFPHDDILKEEVKKNIKKHGVLTDSSVLLGSDSSACVNNKFSQRNANQHTFSKGLSPVCDTDISQKCLQFGKYPSDTYLPADENTKEYLKCTKDYSVLREFSTAGGKKITVSQNSLNAAKSLLNEDLVEGESMKKDIKKHRESKEILATDTKKKFSKRSLKIEKALSNDNDHDALGDENSVILKYLEKNGDHRTLSVKLSDLSIERKKFLIENTKHDMNFKGLATRGEKENVSEESLFHHSLLTDEITSITTNKNKISVLEDPLDLKKYSLDEVLTESKNIVSASKGVKQKLDSKEISITDSKIAKFVPSDEVLNGNTKCLEYNERHEQHNFSVMVRDDSSENEKITLSSENREQRSVCKGFSTADGRKILVSEKSLEFARNVFDENLVKNENNESFVNNIKHLTNSSSVSFIGDKEDCVLMKDQLSENNVFVQKGWSMSTGIAGELEHAFVSDEVSLTDNLLDNKDLVEEYKPTSCIFNVNFDSVSKPLLKNHDVPLTISKQFPVVVGKETEKYARCLDKHDVVGKQLLGEIQNFAKRKQINCLKSEVIKVSDERQALNSNMKRKVVQGKNDMVFCENTHLSEKPRSSDYRCCIPPEQKICKTPLHVMSSSVIHDRRSAHCPVLPMSSNPLYFQSQFANTSCDQTSYISDFKKSTFITPYKKTSISPVVYGVKRPRTPIEDETIFPWKKSVKHYDIFSRTCQQNMECSKVYEVKNAITGIQQPQNKVVNVEIGKAQDVHYNQLELHTKNQEVVYKQPCQNQNKVHQENLEKNKFHFQKEGKIENNVIYQANMRCFEDNKKNKNYFKSQSKDQHQETVNSEDQVINSEIQRTVKTNLGDHKTEKINLEEQKTKTNSREKKMLKVQSGMLWRMIHAENHRRFKLKQLAREKYASGNPESLVAAGIQRRTLTVTASTAENFVFFLPDHLGQNVSEMINGIPVGDGAHLIPTADLKVGKEEFFWALLHSPSVDPSLVNRLWVYNHYHWIVWKLAAMEVAFPDILGGRYLTLHHVMLQLKYRYDREIEHCERSALKKILERDDTPAKTLVLCVSNVISDKNEKLKLATALQQNYEVQVELTDGWYSIQAQLDSPLIRIVQQGRLKVGQKLITSGAELIGSDKACSPLEVSSDLKLKLSTNSTRRARWDLRLGFFHCPVPFPVSLSSLFPDGGTVGCVEIVVVQLYPLQYMEKTSDGRKVFRNETMEVKSVEKHQKLQEYYLEKVKAKLQTNMEKKELEMEMKSDKQKRYHQLTKSYVENITSGKELYQLLQDADDPVFYESILSKSQEENLRSYQQELQQKKLSEFQEQLKLAVSEEKERGEFPEDRVVVPLLKAKVLGISSKDRKHKKFAMLLFWNPSKDVIQMIVEGQVVKLYHLNIRKRNEILELSSTRHTRLEKLSKSKDTLEMVISPKQPISLVNLCNPDFKPLEEEVDVVGLVFSVEFSNNNATDTILLTDGKLNIISIKVFGGLSSISAEGIVKVGSYMLARNLRFQNKTCLIATEGSIFTTSSTIAEFQELKRSIKDETATIQSALNLFHTCSSNHHKVSGMLAGCQTSYSLHPLTSPSYNPKHTPSRRAYPTYSPVSHMNEGGKSSSTISIPSNSHNRISQLEKYRCPPPLSITSMTSPMVKKNFRLPSKLADNKF